MNANVRNAYLGQSVGTASPARLLVMLYDRLVLDVSRAIEAQEASDVMTANTNLIHAQEIVLELRTSLKLDAWEGAERLASIYAWLHGELVRANIRKDVAITRDCLAIVEPLAETWREAAALSAASLAG
ncbi:MAG: flagellar export chaperone FliS [Nocardioidaceae bacterium]